MIGDNQLHQAASNSNFFDGVKGNSRWQMACDNLPNVILAFAGFFESSHHVLQHSTNGGAERSLSPLSNRRGFVQSLVGALRGQDEPTVRRLTSSWVLFLL